MPKPSWRHRRPPERPGGAPARGTPRGAPTQDGRRPGVADVSLIYGFHSVLAALRGGRRRPRTLYATEAAAARLQPELAAAGLTAEIVTAEVLSRRLGAGAVHQGVLLEAEPLADLDLSDIVAASGVTLVLDQITDPHNVGAIVRTAAAFAVDAIVTTERHAPELDGIVAKAASGGLEHVPVVRVVNLARALEELGDMGYLRIGLDSEAPETLAALPLSRPLALVLGAEGKGLRRLSRERCDVLARLALPGAIQSLNVSNACAVALALVMARAQPAAP